MESHTSSNDEARKNASAREVIEAVTSGIAGDRVAGSVLGPRFLTGDAAPTPRPVEIPPRKAQKKRDRAENGPDRTQNGDDDAES